MYIYLNSVHKYLYVHSKTVRNQLPHSLGVCLLARFKVGAQSAPAYGRCCKAGESQVTYTIQHRRQSISCSLQQVIAAVNKKWVDV